MISMAAMGLGSGLGLYKDELAKDQAFSYQSALSVQSAFDSQFRRLYEDHLYVQSQYIRDLQQRAELAARKDFEDQHRAEMIYERNKNRMRSPRDDEWDINVVHPGHRVGFKDHRVVIEPKYKSIRHRLQVETDKWLGPVRQLIKER